MKYSLILALTAGAIGMTTVSTMPASAQQWYGPRAHTWGAYGNGYYAYGSAYPRGYYYGRRGYRNAPISRDTPAPGSSRLCVGEQATDSAYPRWMCR